jgi:hypothetical protein
MKTLTYGLLCSIPLALIACGDPNSEVPSDNGSSTGRSDEFSGSNAVAGLPPGMTAGTYRLNDVRDFSQKWELIALKKDGSYFAQQSGLGFDTETFVNYGPFLIIQDRQDNATSLTIQFTLADQGNELRQFSLQPTNTGFRLCARANYKSDPSYTVDECYWNSRGRENNGSCFTDKDCSDQGYDGKSCRLDLCY